MPIKTKNIALTDFHVKFDSAGAATIEGYGSTFGNMDHDRDIVMNGAFKESLAARMPAMLYQHQTDRLPGIWEKASEDSKGLLLAGKTLNTSLGRDTAEELRSGALKSMSIGYSIKDSSYDRPNLVQYLKRLELHEVSLVTFPANEKATITDVKAALEDVDTACDLIDQCVMMVGGVVGGLMEATPEMMGNLLQILQGASGLLEDPDGGDEAGEAALSERALEKLLRDAGYSRRKAKVMASAGAKAIDNSQRDVGGSVAELTKLFQQFK